MHVDFFSVDNLDSAEKFVFADSKEKKKIMGTKNKCARRQFYHGGQESSPFTIQK